MDSNRLEILIRYKLVILNNPGELRLVDVSCCNCEIAQ